VFVIQSLRNSIFACLKSFSRDGLAEYSAEDVLIDSPGDVNLGELYTNAALVFAKTLKMNPRALANNIAAALTKNDNVSNVDIADPGFINFKLKPCAWHSTIDEILASGDTYGSSNKGRGEVVNVEFVSANPTGPLHTGHARNAVFGSVIANLLEKIGYKVTKEFYINDQGNQIKALSRSIYLRYRECLGTKINKSDFSGNDMYLGEYVKGIAKNLADLYGDEFLNKKESEWITSISQFAVKKMMDNIKGDLSLLGINMDVYTSETAVCKKNMVNEALAILASEGDIYDGIIPKPKGIDAKDWEEKPQTLFRSTKYGDDIDRAIRKSDGTWTYFAGDIAYHLDKIQRGFKKMVNVLGADHTGYIKRIKAAVKALSGGEANIDIRLYQLVNFLENGEQVRMSKRSGNFITLRDVVERVGKDITRFMMISRHHDVTIDFDFKKVAEHSMDNPIFYIQYAYARISSVFRNAAKIFENISVEELKTSSKSCLQDETEIDLMKSLCFWPEQVASAAIALEPHRIPHYLYKVSSLFHSLWNKGKTNTILRFIDEKDRATTIARLALLESTRIVLKDGLKLIGITPLEEMK
jgi:arginyl-tRNA synthetase